MKNKSCINFSYLVIVIFPGLHDAPRRVFLSLCLPGFSRLHPVAQDQRHSATIPEAMNILSQHSRASIFQNYNYFNSKIMTTWHEH
jgi:hypothetical protein